MGTKDFFNKGYSLKFLKNKAQADFRKDVESFRYVDAYSTRRDRFIPDTDFTTASNFAAYGLAELYYKQSIERIYKTYPYDGSLAERIEWENDSTYLDLHMLENEYPRSNGFVTFNSSSHTYTTTNENGAYSSSAPQYVLFAGNPHPDVSGNYKEQHSAGPSGVGVSKANIYETGSYRTNNLEIDPAKGLTIEFWMKKDGWASTTTTKYEYVFNVVASGSTGDNYGNLRVYTEGKNPGIIGLVVNSGSVSDSTAFNTGLTDGAAGGLADGKWHHYAISFKSSGSVNVAKLYVDGIHKETENNADPVAAIDGKMLATIGALAGPRGTNLTVNDRGWGNVVSCSIDEFRYWKTERDAQQIGRHYKDQVGGGTNTDNIKYDKQNYPVDLGVYYKFNEGITGDDSIDKTILDYSGRISNGTFINYASDTSRNTGSAMVLAGAATKEFKDPVLYSSHPSVVSLLENKRIEGTVHDHENSTSIFKSLPGWIAEEDEEKSSNLKYLTQIMSSVFDELQLQIKALPKLKDVNYPYDTNYERALPFADRLLASRGVDAPELFSDASALAKFLERDEKVLFEKKLYEVKNTIYQNIYNNLTYIQKSKGTTKSVRNLLRCFGVDDELVKINIYAKNDTYEFKNNVGHSALRKKYADFSDADSRFGSTGIYSGSFAATVYQHYDSTNSNSKSYIIGLPSVTHGLSATLEAEIIFPKRGAEEDKYFDLYPGKEVSLFGLHAVAADDDDLSWLNDTINFNVIAIKDPSNERSVKFKLASDAASSIPSLVTTGSFADVYDNEKWNIAFRLRPTKHPLADKVDSSLLPASSAYTVELYGVNYTSDYLQNEFKLSSTMSETAAREFFTKAKRVFAGAHRTNFDGNLITASDVKVSSVAMWYDYLSDDDIKAHARDSNNFGRLHPYRNALFNEGTQNDLDSAKAGNQFLWNVRVPQIDTLLFHWNFENVTGSDANGQFLLHDISSGSADDRTNARYGAFSNVNSYHYSARGDHFVPTNSQVVDVEFVPTARQKLPEVVSSDDMVKILNRQDDVMFTRDTTYVQHIISVEKSMYQTISEEMLRMFATVVDFNNIIGDPVNRYRPSYKQLAKLRSSFFEVVENVPDLEKYVEYFKWIDDSISLFIFQLLPASSNKVEFLRTMVESHILERSKHFNKFPTIEMFNPEPAEAFKGINELLYDWKKGSPPVIGKDGAVQAPHATENQNRNSLWWKERASRSTELASGDNNVDSNKSIILKRIITETSGNDDLALSYGPANLDKKDGQYGAQGGSKTKYSASYYRDRSTSTPVRIAQEFVKTYKGGPNADGQKLHDFYKGVVKFGSDNDYIWLDKTHVVPPVDTLDVAKAESSSSAEGFYLPHKKEFPVKVFTMTATEIIESNADGTGDDDYKYTDSTNKLIMPFSMYANRTGKIQSYGNNNNEVANDYTKEYNKYFDDDYTLFTHGENHGRTSRVEFNNLHHDVYRPTYEVPMQGPFTAQHVGGNQHRHISLNAHTWSALDPAVQTFDEPAENFIEKGWLSNTHTTGTRPEGWELSYGGTEGVGYTGSATPSYKILEIPFAKFNMPPEMSGSQPSPGATDNTGSQDDPSEHDRWVNVHTNPKFLAGSPTGWRFAEHIADPLGGPDTDSTAAQEGVAGNDYFAYAKKSGLDAALGQPLFGFRTPLIDALDYIPGHGIKMVFYYHMYGEQENGTLKLEHSQTEDFSTGVTELTTTWDKGGANEDDAVEITNNQQASKAAAWKKAEVDLTSYVGTRFYVRFLFHSPAFFSACCAIDGVTLNFPLLLRAETSFKLLHPTHDDATRPYAPWTREEFAKRPVNIKNIKVGSKTNLSIYEDVLNLYDKHGDAIKDDFSELGTAAAKKVADNELKPDFHALQRTIAGNYRNTYEYVNTVSRDVNDKAFKEIVNNPSVDWNGTTVYPTEGLQHNFSTRLPARNPDHDPKWATYSDDHLGVPRTQYGTEDRLAYYKTVDSFAQGVKTSSPVGDAPPDVFYLGGRPLQHQDYENKNPQKTRIVNLFSAPGDIMDSCKGFLDEGHRTYSAYNAMPWRNYHVREQLKTSLTAHCGRFGKGAHTQDALVATGSIKVVDNAALEALAVAGGLLTKPAIQLVDWKGATLYISFVPNGTQGLQLETITKVGVKPTRLAVTQEVGATAAATAVNIRECIILANSQWGSPPDRLNIATEIEPADTAKIILTPNSDKDPDPATAIAGAVGNTPIRTGKAGLVALDNDGDGTIEAGEFDDPIDSTILQVVSFYGGADPTARVLKSQAISPTQQTGSISKADYTVVSASFHKYHRNRGNKLILGKNTQESWEYAISGSTQLPHDHIARDSVYDNAYVSHTIPRTNDQVRWVRSITGMIQEELWLQEDTGEVGPIQLIELDP